jgi:hypothetical protein
VGEGTGRIGGESVVQAGCGSWVVGLIGGRLGGQAVAQVECGSWVMGLVGGESRMWEVVAELQASLEAIHIGSRWRQGAGLVGGDSHGREWWQSLGRRWRREASLEAGRMGGTWRRSGEVSWASWASLEASRVRTEGGAG